MLRFRENVHGTLQCLILMTVLSIAPACAQQSFDNVAGSWSGSGSMKPSDGPRERVRCKVDYIIKNVGQSVKLNLRCASDAYKMELSAILIKLAIRFRVTGLKASTAKAARSRGKTTTVLLKRKSRAIQSPPC